MKYRISAQFEFDSNKPLEGVKKDFLEWLQTNYRNLDILESTLEEIEYRHLKLEKVWEGNKQ